MMRSAGGLAMAVGCYVAASCGPDATAPMPAGQVPAIRPHFSVEQQIGSYSIPIPPFHGTGAGDVVDVPTGIILPAYSSVVITISGAISLAANPDYTCCLGSDTPYAGQSIGPPGLNGMLRVSLENASIPFQPDSAGATTVSTDTLYVSQSYELTVSRSRIPYGASCFSNPYPGQPGECTCPDGPCISWAAGVYLLSGTQTVTVTRIDDHLRLEANPTSGPAGMQVTFTPSTDNESAFSVQSWHWVPDDSAAVDSTAACGSGVTPCTTNVYASGTMSVLATVGGRTRQASAHVTARMDSLVILPSSVLQKPGETATFTASTQSGTHFTVLGWSWTAVSPPPRGEALTAQPACGTTTSCSLPVYEAGYVTVTAQVDGESEPQSASASVGIQNCPPTGDSVLDSPEVSKGLIDAMIASHPNATPGTGVKHEVPGIIYQRLDDSSYFFVPYPDPNATECHSSLGAHTPPTGTREVASAHTHPSSTREPVYGCVSINGQPQAQTRNDGKPVPTARPSSRGGGSPADWAEAESGFPVYTVDKAGEIHRLDPGTAPADWSSNPNRWERDGDSICWQK